MRPAQAAVCSERLCPRISAARAPGRADRGSYLAVALGLGAPQAGALQTGAHGPCALTGSRRLGTGAEGKLGPRPDPAIGGGGGGGKPGAIEVHLPPGPGCSACTRGCCPTLGCEGWADT
ncbi:hypothetical protein NN561_016335 [Cricetulus griseus]